MTLFEIVQRSGSISTACNICCLYTTLEHYYDINHSI